VLTFFFWHGQTFIRGAAGKALVDSPALNPMSRQVLVSVQRSAPPTAPLVVPGPGPIEPGSAPAPSPLSAPINTSKPPPPLPPDAGSGGLLEGGEGSGGEEEEEEDAGFAKHRSAADPYASLDAAFGDSSQNASQLNAVHAELLPII